MEKRRPHYSLSRVKQLIQNGSYRVTRTALSRAVRDFGLFDATHVAGLVLKIEARQFYKSMTTLHDSSLWQDVYHGDVDGTAAYVKIQIVDETIIVISFKRLEED
jgi:motility quorum-sensing regulator/GCU-specific mRNA interferase toxin